MKMLNIHIMWNLSVKNRVMSIYPPASVMKCDGGITEQMADDRMWC